VRAKRFPPQRLPAPERHTVQHAHAGERRATLRQRHQASLQAMLRGVRPHCNQLAGSTY